VGRVLHHWASEPILVPRGKDESDVHVLVMCHDEATDCGFVAVYDGQRLAAGPVARVFFDHYCTATFHGAWLALR
jgi:carotenoid cleavage dioxygenase-like enzyme